MLCLALRTCRVGGLGFRVATSKPTQGGLHQGFLCDADGGGEGCLGSGAETFWDGLLQSRTMQSVVPLERWDVDALYDPDGGSGKMYTRIAAFASVRDLKS